MQWLPSYDSASINESIRSTMYTKPTARATARATATVNSSTSYKRYCNCYYQTCNCNSTYQNSTLQILIFLSATTYSFGPEELFVFDRPEFGLFITACPTHSKDPKNKSSRLYRLIHFHLVTGHTSSILDIYLTVACPSQSFFNKQPHYGCYKDRRYSHREEDS